MPSPAVGPILEVAHGIFVAMRGSKAICVFATDDPKRWLVRDYEGTWPRIGEEVLHVYSSRAEAFRRGPSRWLCGVVPSEHEERLEEAHERKPGKRFDWGYPSLESLVVMLAWVTYRNELPIRPEWHYQTVVDIVGLRVAIEILGFGPEFISAVTPTPEQLADLLSDSRPHMRECGLRLSALVEE